MQSQDHPAPAVALLFEDSAQSAYLRQALAALGARIVHEGPAASLDARTLADVGAEVVVVNLDETVDACLDELSETLDESLYRVIYNDAEASQDLSGWDQARWARHLAAKLMGALDVDPPRPAGARSVDVSPAVDIDSEPVASTSPVPEDTEHSAVDDVGATVDAGTAEQGETPELADSLGAELQALLDEGEGLLGEAGAGPAAEGVTPQPIDDEAADAPAFTVADDADMFARIDDAPVSIDEESALVDADTLFADLADTAPEPPMAADESVETLADGLDSDAVEAPTTESELASVTPSASPFGELGLADIDSGTDAAETVDDERSDTRVSAPDWDLVDFGSDVPESEESDTVSVHAEEHGDPGAFGIEKVSAAEFLTPDEPEGDDGLDLSAGLTLELVSMEEALAPTVSETPAHEMMLDESAGLSRLTAVAADADDIDAVEAFVGALPPGLPSAILVVLFTDTDVDIETVCDRLAVATLLRVRRAADDMTVRSGDVVVADASMPVRVGREGRIRAIDDASSGDHLRLAAKVFGPDLLTLVFGGPMHRIGDLVDAVREGGGRVWARLEADQSAHPAVELLRRQDAVEHAEPAHALAERLARELGVAS